MLIPRPQQTTMPSASRPAKKACQSMEMEMLHSGKTSRMSPKTFSARSMVVLLSHLRLCICRRIGRRIVLGALSRICWGHHPINVSSRPVSSQISKALWFANIISTLCGWSSAFICCIAIWRQAFSACLPCSLHCTIIF